MIILEEMKDARLLNRRIGGGNKLFGGISCRLELVWKFCSFFGLGFGFY